MSRLHPRTWILVADSARARVYAWTGVLSEQDSPLAPLAGFEFSYHHLHGRDLVSDRPGRVHESVGVTRHAIEPRIDPVRQTEQRFAVSVVDALTTALADDAFDRLIVLAGPTMLGDLRSEFPAALQAAVHAERAKDLTHNTIPELARFIIDNELLHTSVVPDESSR